MPLVAGFSRVRRSGVVKSEISNKTAATRKKYYNMPHITNVSFYLDSTEKQDYIQTFINSNEGKKFICHLSADRPIVEPYVVQAIDKWSHREVTAISAMVSCRFEVFSTKTPELDEALVAIYSVYGDDFHDILLNYPIVEIMP